MNNLQRFIYAQEGSILGYNEKGVTYEEALEEIKIGNKKSHWIWYIFPQMKGLGKSELSEFYGIKDREEGKAYLNHPILGTRLKEVTTILYESKHNIYETFGKDIVKVYSCIKLFASLTDKNSIFNKLMIKYCWH